MKSKDKIFQFSLITSILGVFVLFSYAFYALIVVVVLFMNKNIFNPTASLDLCSPKYPAIYCVLHKSSIPLVILMVASYVLPGIFYGWRFFKDFIINSLAYLFYSPAYIHTLLIYAFCNG